MLIEEKLKIVKTARYYLYGNPAPQIENIWFVCHGYGQLAKEFINSFNVLVNDKSLIVAPEALNRYYRKGSHGEVGASWMTKEDRLSEIDDYTNYLQSVYIKILTDVEHSKVQINVLGFSQGSATIGKWIFNCRPKVDNIIFWAGDLPDEAVLNENRKYLKDKKIFIVWGKNDPLIKKDIIEKSIHHFDTLNIRYKRIQFEGKHEINQSALKDIEKLIL